MDVIYGCPLIKKVTQNNTHIIFITTAQFNITAAAIKNYFIATVKRKFESSVAFFSQCNLQSFYNQKQELQ